MAPELELLELLVLLVRLNESRLDGVKRLRTPVPFGLAPGEKLKLPSGLVKLRGVICKSRLPSVV